MATKFYKGPKHYAWILNNQSNKWECIAVIVSPGLANLLGAKLREIYTVVHFTTKPAYNGEDHHG